MRPARGVGRARELVEVSILIQSVEFGYSTPVVIEEKYRVIAFITRNDVRPGCPYERVAIELCDTALVICVIELAQSRIMIVEKQAHINVSFLSSANAVDALKSE